MGSRILLAAGLVGSGVAVATAIRFGLWGLLVGGVLVAVWLGTVVAFDGALPRSLPVDASGSAEQIVPRLLLDAAPTPLLGIDRGAVRALNRAARRLFATDDRVLPAPAGLDDPAATRLRHEGRSWRIDRVVLDDGGTGRAVAALIDIEQEERAAEARAAAELIQVLGHELLNGLAPIVSLAESGVAAAERADADPALVREILGTIARRADGLQRFTEAYRVFARLPEPVRAPVRLAEMADDLARLFAVRWPAVALTVDVTDESVWPLDRDQASQALWALMQNAAEAAVAAQGDAAAVEMTLAVAGDALDITVRDNGGGVTPDEAARIFRPFHTTKSEGTGIGLSLARQIVQGHGGSIVLADPVRTAFRMHFPG